MLYPLLLLDDMCLNSSSHFRWSAEGLSPLDLGLTVCTTTLSLSPLFSDKVPGLSRDVSPQSTPSIKVSSWRDPWGTTCTRRHITLHIYMRNKSNEKYFLSTFNFSCCFYVGPVLLCMYLFILHLGLYIFVKLFVLVHTFFCFTHSRNLSRIGRFLMNCPISGSNMKRNPLDSRSQGSHNDLQCTTLGKHSSLQGPYPHPKKDQGFEKKCLFNL